MINRTYIVWSNLYLPLFIKANTKKDVKNKFALFLGYRDYNNMLKELGKLKVQVDIELMFSSTDIVHEPIGLLEY